MTEVLKQVESAAMNHRHRLLRNESATRTTLIDPVLRALGWDVANPHKVVVEASARRGRNLIYADYGLFIGDAIGIVVEAKALGEDLRIHSPQVVDYAYAFKADNVFLTNGLTWEHYDFTSFSPKALTPACVLHLTTSNFDRTAAYLKSELGLQHDDSESQHNLTVLHAEADELLTKFSTAVDKIYNLGFAEPIGRQLPTAALAARLDELRANLAVIAMPLPENTDVEGLIIHWICTLVDENGDFAERASELYGRFQTEHAQFKAEFSLAWPRGVSVFGGHLNRTVLALRQRRVEASSRRDSKGIIWTFVRLKEPDILP